MINGFRLRLSGPISSYKIGPFPRIPIAVAGKEAKSSIQVIERMMHLLDALAEHGAPVNLKQLALRTALHPSTAHRILAVMVRSEERRVGKEHRSRWEAYTDEKQQQHKTTMLDTH